MIKKILVLASQRKKSQEAISFLLKQTSKYKITGLLCTDEKQFEQFRKQIKEINPAVVFCPNKILAEQITDEFNIKCFYDYAQYTQFLKASNCDLVISDLTGIDSIKLILATVGEYKDVFLLNLEPILYSGKIIINEAKNKGVKLQFITHQFYSFDLFLKYKNDLTNINKIALINFDSKYDKENLDEYISSKNTMSEFKKILYYKNKMWLPRHLFVMNSLFDFETNCFEYYKSNTDALSLVFQLKNGSNCMTITENEKETILSYYFNDNQKIKLETINNLEVKLQKINIKEIPALYLANQALEKGGTYPIIYQMAYDLCAEAMYSGKIKNKNCFTKIVEELLEDRSLYSKNINIQTIFALYEKVKIKLNFEYVKKVKDESKPKIKK